MRVLLFGPYTMLGSTLSHFFARKGNVVIPVPKGCPYDSRGELVELIEQLNPDIIVNASGTDTGNSQMIRVNALFPHVLAGVTDKPIYHMSTDRVFAGTSEFAYAAKCTPDARDVFGKTKALGEVKQDNVINIRTSFIGRGRGFVKNLISKPDSFKGMTQAFWSGSTVEAVALGVMRVVHLEYRGTVHLATETPISRHMTAQHILKHYGMTDQMTLVEHPFSNYALVPTVKLIPLEKAISYWKDQ